MEDSQPQQEHQASSPHKSVTIHHDGQQFHVIGGKESKTHHDINSALAHAKSIFGGHESGSEDTAFEAMGAGDDGGHSHFGR